MRRPVLAAARGMGVGQVHARVCRLKGRADLVPEAHRFGQASFGTCRIAVGEAHSSASVRGASDQRLGVEAGSHKRQFVGGRSSPAEATGVCSIDSDNNQDGGE